MKDEDTFPDAAALRLEHARKMLAEGRYAPPPEYQLKRGDMNPENWTVDNWGMLVPPWAYLNKIGKSGYSGTSKQSYSGTSQQSRIDDLEISSTVRKGAVDHKISWPSMHAEITLSAEDWKEEKPTSFELYIWSMPLGKESIPFMRAVIGKITGHNVKDVGFQAGNGHGFVEVTYEV